VQEGGTGDRKWARTFRPSTSPLLGLPEKTGGVAKEQEQRRGVRVRRGEEGDDGGERILCPRNLHLCISDKGKKLGEGRGKPAALGWRAKVNFF